jgi:hypothetical protein
MNTTRYQNFDCVSLGNASLNLLVTQSAGPRILSLSLRGEENLLASLPDFTVQRPDGKTFRFWGGHRLWHAPEHMPRTYGMDDSPVEIVAIPNGLSVKQPTEPETGIQKSLRIELAGDQPKVTLTHTLTNHNAWAVECAPWAITQFKPGGVAILPLNRAESGLLPNRSLAVWSYTDLSSPCLHFGREHLWIQAQMTSSFKIGFPNPRGWLAYVLNGTLFVKRAEYQRNAEYYDFGSSSECYCCDSFLELETLAPITKLQPGAAISHLETWELYKTSASIQNEQDIRALIQDLNLE